MNRRIMNNQGFSLAELAITVGIMAILLLVVTAGGSGLFNQSRITTALESISTLKTASQAFLGTVSPAGGTQTTYTDLTVQALKDNGLLPSGFSALGANPWGGDYLILPNTDITKFDIKLTKVEATPGPQLEKKIGGKYDAGSKTYTVTY
ncbi:MAG: prepilin-type N-terminal cleavage/methylation domain-containing protein [Candidatus Omnitrophica bacterium]|nr:prepilin-type N-terminal cleavage/methylation domain-containing protein [Candidatus Omnitrophota bacterium]